VRSPDVERDGPAGVGAVQLGRHAVDVGDLAARMTVAGDLVGEVPRDDRGVQLALAHARARPVAGDLQAARADRGPVAGGVGRSDALPDHDAGGVEALEQPRVDRML
jgi:hypothetical protein